MSFDEVAQAVLNKPVVDVQLIEQILEQLLESGKFTIIQKEVKRQTLSGVLYVPIGLVGKKVFIVVKNEN